MSWCQSRRKRKASSTGRGGLSFPLFHPSSPCGSCPLRGAPASRLSSCFGTPPLPPSSSNRAGRGLRPRRRTDRCGPRPLLSPPFAGRTEGRGGGAFAFFTDSSFLLEAKQILLGPRARGGGRDGSEGGEWGSEGGGPGENYLQENKTD